MRTPCPVWGPLAGEDAEERSSATGRQSAGCIGSPPAPAGPTHRSRSCCCWPAAPWGSGHTHRLTGCRRPGFPAPEQVAENCPSVAGVRGAAGVGTGGGENDAPQRGRVPGEEPPGLLGNSAGRGLCARAARGGVHALLGCEGCLAHCEGSPPHTTGCERAAPGRRPAARCQTTPSSVPDDTVDGLQRGCRGSNFLAEVEVGMWGWKRGLCC